MKKKLTFLVVLITISAFSFGQKTGTNDYGAIKTSLYKKENKRFERGEEKGAPDQLIKYHQEKHTPFQLKNITDTKQRLDSVTTASTTSAAQYKDEYTYNEGGFVTLRLGLSRTSPSNPWSYQSKVEYAYNEMGFRTLESFYSYSLDEQWIGSWKEEYEYNEEGQWTSWAVYYDWDYENNDWIGDVKEEVIYDEFGKTEQILHFEWDAQSAIHWALNKKSDYYWEENVDTLSVITYKWDTTNQLWVNFQKYIATLNDYGFTTSSVHYVWSDAINDWQNNRKYEYCYDNNGNDTLNIWYNWNIDESQWIPEFKIEYTYEDSSNLIREEDFLWDLESGVWITSWIYEAEYDENGNPIIELHHYLSPLPSEWAIIKYEYSFDENSNLLSASEYSSDHLNIEWVGLSRIECSYNLNFTKDDLIIPFINRFYSYYSDGNNMLTGVKDYNWYEGNWELSNESFYHYSEQASGVEKHYPEAVLLYPNPVSNQITIQLPSGQMQGLLKIYNLHGSLVLHKIITGKNQIQIGFLDAGFYFYQVTSNNDKYCGKFIKE
jgi:hypothetical protein